MSLPTQAERQQALIDQSQEAVDWRGEPQVVQPATPQGTMTAFAAEKQSARRSHQPAAGFASVDAQMAKAAAATEECAVSVPKWVTVAFAARQQQLIPIGVTILQAGMEDLNKQACQAKDLSPQLLDRRNQQAWQLQGLPKPLTLP